MLVLTLLISVLYGNIFGYNIDSKPYYDLDKARDYFEEFLVNYNKTYADKEEKERRLEIFKDALVNINKLNLESEDAIFGITKFSDLTPDEFEFRTGLRHREKLSLRKDKYCVKLRDKDVKTNTAPKHRFDWRDLNVVTEVKNQLPCGSCWAFSTTGVVEAQYALKHKQLVSLSPQQLVDCFKSDHDNCGGISNLELAFDSLIKEGGQMLEADYPYKYKATQNICKFNSSKVIAKVTKCYSYQFNLKEEDKLKEVLYTRGPLSICMEFNRNLYTNYHGGIISHVQCGTRPNHAVLLVGYGITHKGKKYWIVKNSYGPQWGDHGYFKLEMGTNACGIMNDTIIAATVS